MKSRSGATCACPSEHSPADCARVRYSCGQRLSFGEAAERHPDDDCSCACHEDHIDSWEDDDCFCDNCNPAPEVAA